MGNTSSNHIQGNAFWVWEKWAIKPTILGRQWDYYMTNILEMMCHVFDFVLPRDFQKNGHASGNLTNSSWLLLIFWIFHNGPAFGRCLYPVYLTIAAGKDKPLFGWVWVKRDVTGIQMSKNEKTPLNSNGLSFFPWGIQHFWRNRFEKRKKNDPWWADIGMD